MIPQFVISTIAVLVVVAIAAYGFTTRSYFVHFVLIFTPLAIYLVNHPNLWMIAILGLSQSGLIVPGLPQGLQVIHVLMAGLIALLIGRTAIEKKSTGLRRGVVDFFLLCFLGVLLLVAYTRGFGIRALGGDSWGGMSYVRLWVTGLFFILSRSIVLSENEMKRALYIMLALSTLPPLAQIVFLVSGGKIYHQYLFLEAYVSGLFESLRGYETGGVVRLHMLGHTANTLLMMTVVLLQRANPFSKAAYPILLLVCIGMAALSGFRGRVIYMIVMILMLHSVQGTRIHFRMAALVLAAIVLLLPVVYLTAPYMPGAAQRAFSWLPGIQIPWHVELEATQSNMDRRLVWELAWRDVPRYFWIGKGFTVKPIELESPSVRVNWVIMSYLSHNFHNGPLSLLVGTGIFGFIFGTLFLISTCFYYGKYFLAIKAEPVLVRAYRFLYIQHVLNVISYYLLYGDVRESFPMFFINLSFLHSLLNASATFDALPRYRRKSIRATF